MVAQKTTNLKPAYVAVVRKAPAQTYFVKRPVHIPLPDTKPISIWK